MADRPYTTDPSRRCERCGAAVSKQFIRVFGEGYAVYGCLDCLTRHQLSNGEAAIRPDTDTESADESAGPYTRWDYEDSSRANE